MQRLRLVLAIVAVFGFTGCTKSGMREEERYPGRSQRHRGDRWSPGGGSRVTGQPTISITGVAERPSPVSTRQVNGFNYVQIDGIPMYTYIQPYEKIVTRYPVKMEFSQEWEGSRHKYEIVMGPDWKTNEDAEGAFVEHSAAHLKLWRGWAFFWGRLPITRTTWVSAGGEGTAFAIQIVDATLHRVFFPKQNRDESYVCLCRKADDTCTLELKKTDGEGTFVDVTGYCTFGSITKISDDAGAEADFEKMESIAQPMY